MADSRERRENHQIWDWCPVRRAWVYNAPHVIYEHEGGYFTVSTCEVPHPGSFATFEEAEAQALGLAGPYYPDATTD